MLSGRGQVIRPLSNSRSVVNKAPDRRYREHGNIIRQRGIRLGAEASGEFINHLQDTECKFAALREIAMRGAPGFLRAQGQYGFP